MINKIFSIKNETDFNSVALEVFNFQYLNTAIYRSYIDLFKSKKIEHYLDIPFLPIQFFKSCKVIAKKHSIEKIFQSSGTTQSNRSQHHIHNLTLYEESFKIGFKNLYGDISEWTVLALLPSYLEQGESSLIYMVNHFIEKGSSESRYIDFNFDSIKLLSDKLRDKKVLLIGVTYALLDLAEKGSVDLKNWVIMETGGMKGRRKEIIRKELHKQLKSSFNVDFIHSEYGMTELLSQAYSKGNGLFSSPPWMKIIIRDFEDPFSYKKPHSSGGINIIDLANIYSCSFIETQDIGKEFSNGEFEILGRFDKAEVRGCNLLSF
ncbi:MAG: acyl transferase [Crocinitomicaceae bacterium TMED135]|nr:MAG: acyl transferase [Crocinitomicaceae bacterium TMED135]